MIFWMRGSPILLLTCVVTWCTLVEPLVLPRESCSHMTTSHSHQGQSSCYQLKNISIFLIVCRTLAEIYKLQDEEERFVSYLPLSHVAANIMDIFMVIQCLGTLYFANKDALKGTLVATLKEAQPTVFFGVPRVWEKIREKMVEIGKSNTGIKKAVGLWAKKTGLEFNKAKIGGKKPRSISFKVMIVNIYC